MRLGLVTDTHIAPGGIRACSWHGPFAFAEALDRLRAARELLGNRDVDSVLMLGDLTHLGDESSLRIGLAALGASGVPSWVVPGDHDILDDTEALRRLTVDCRVKIPSLAGEPLSSEVVLHGIDIIEDERGRIHARQPPDARRWGHDIAVVMSHRPIFDVSEALSRNGVNDAGRLMDPYDVAQTMLLRPAPTILVCGHLHVRHCQSFGNVLQIVTPALIEDPAEVSIIEMSVGETLTLGVEFVSVVDHARAWPALVPSGTDWTWQRHHGWTRLDPRVGP
jgi:hypothetical protein